MNLMTTIAGSLLEGFYPRGWDLGRIDQCIPRSAEDLAARQSWWDPRFEPVPCATLEDFDVMLGHEIALTIRLARDQSRDLALILPVGPMGMYRWATYFLREWGVDCGHVHGFNMDEWSDRDGRTLPATDPGSFQNAMEAAFYGPLGAKTVPPDRRWFATADRLPHYAGRIAEIQSAGGELVVIFGIGRVCHVAFWEPHFAAEYPDLDAWKAQTHRLGRRSTRSRSSRTPSRASGAGRPWSRPSPTRSAPASSSRPIGSSAGPTASSAGACNGRG